ncbi:MAG TPA: ribonuclease Z [Savagea sp.]
MELLFLGTGAGMPSKQRNTSSVIVNARAEGDGYWMVDCGEATQHQLLHTSVKPSKLNKVFITHLHGDHLFGLPGFLSSRSFLGGDEPLDLYGPVGIKDWIETTFQLTKTHLTYPLRIHEVEGDGVVCETDRFIISTKKLAHVIDSYGYRFEEKLRLGKLDVERAIAQGVPKGPLFRQLKEGHDVTLEDGTVVRSEAVTGPAQKGWTVTVLGDTRQTEASVELARDADVLVHEATFDDATETIAADYGHSTIRQAATVAREANVGLLLATHISARFNVDDIPTFVQQGRDVFPSTYVVFDGTTVTLEGDEPDIQFHRSYESH